ncbi:hypothetical protein K4K60_005303 [Colletotrichum sp. SAR11_57]|nr:hypothetical protein K4K60_005303 [Colletotrichum sp. SAR11_57]
MEICYDAYDPSYAPPTPPKRSNIFNGSGYLVVRLSTGGIVVSHPSAVDLVYLGLPRTHDTCISTPAVEDALATRMLRLGAPWWPSWATYITHRKRLDDEGVMRRLGCAVLAGHTLRGGRQQRGQVGRAAADVSLDA